MKRSINLLLAFVLWGPGMAVAESTPAKQLLKATDVLNEIMSTPDKGIPQDLLDKAVCVGIIPSEIRAAFVVGGEYGRGVLVCRRGGNGSWGAPSLFTLGGANVGFQLGGKATDVVFIVMNAAGAKKLVADSVKFGADVSATAGPVGRTAEGATDLQLHAEIISYSRTRGLFAGVSLEGDVLKQDSDENERLYGQKVNARALLIYGSVSAPSAARPLDKALAKYSPHGGEPFTKA
ncbi:MAG TPA: lipid-binding SYLF domain-containing protein [Terriglobia bacterium]|nr:lipid-binding SYLF domain-containing protein [Terriglobia bacterium]